MSVYPAVSNYIKIFILFSFPFLLLNQAQAIPDRSGDPLNGKLIRSISIALDDIFESPGSNDLYKSVNKVKVNTQEYVIVRELLFKEGQNYDGFLIRESERRLRQLRFLRKIKIEGIPEGDVVDIIVHAQDTWTLIPQLNITTGTGRKSRSVGVAESNFLGHGKRLEFSYEEDEARQILEGVYDDNRLFNSDLRFLGAHFSRSDGQESYLFLGDPIRTLLDKTSWFTSYGGGDTIGRLFRNGRERYIFRQQNYEVNARYTFTRGDPETILRRYALGWDFFQSTFEQADQEDYDDLNLDPNDVSNDSGELPNDRRYTGPVFRYEYQEPDFISMNYIDRFERIEDYNLGSQYDLSLTYAPEYLLSSENAMLVSFNRSRGIKFGPQSFFRGELAYAGRYNGEVFSNGLARLEAKYFKVLGDLHWGEMFLGKHTLATAVLADFGHDLDGDRQLTLGADNGLRGYRARSFTGDKRMVFNFEDRMHFIDDFFKLVSVGGAVFCEFGGATYDNFGRIVTDGLYGDAGVGLRFAFPRSSGGRVLRVDLAFPMRSGPDGSDAFQLRFILSGGQLFSARLRSETLGPEKANVAVGFDR